VFWLNWARPLHLDPMDSFKIRMHTSQLDSHGLCRGNLQKMGSENKSVLFSFIITLPRICDMCRPDPQFSHEFVKCVGVTPVPSNLVNLN
jgi:hypothetical protein